MNIFGVHLDRSATMANVERLTAEIEGLGRQAVYFNVNAANAAKRAEVLDQVGKRLAEQGNGASVMVLFHSLAFGTLGQFIAGNAKEAISQAQMEMTLDVMANSLVYWTQDLVSRGLIGGGARIFAMTSSGSHRVLPNYGAVSAAKACLESHCRQLAVELALKHITVNAVRAGITDTPALRKIPGHDRLIHEASTRNPMGRMTRPDDIASLVAAMCVPGTYWLTGDVLGADGGEDNIG